MAYTTQQFITNAYYLSNIVSRDLETVSGSQLEDGLFRLNGYLAMQAADVGHIPTYTVYDFVGVIGQEIYFIPGLVEVETMTFNIGTVRYSMQPTSREDYFATGRIDGIESLPYQWHMERAFQGGIDGANIYLYYTPIQPYPFKLTGKFLLTSVALNQDLSLFFEPFYLEYMLYKLAIYLCEYFNVTPPMSVEAQLKSFEQIIRDISPMDLTMQKLNYFGQATGFNYVDAVIGLGWRPAN